jgi:hypothetical protein
MIMRKFLAATPFRFRAMRRPRFGAWLLGLTTLATVAAGTPAQAVKVSATTAAGYSNTMGLGPKLMIFAPGTPNFSGAASLPAPPVFGTNTDTFTAFQFGTGITPVQMTGDAISSISQPSANVFDISLTLTNYTIQSISLASNEYVYLNIWETFTGLPISSTANWTGSTVAIAGTFSKTSLGDGLFIEPIVTALTPGPNTWGPVSSFFGGLPAGLSGSFSASTAVSPLSAYIDGLGNLSIGFEAIVGLANNDSTGVDFLTMPSSWDLKLRLDNSAANGTPVPGPLPLLGAASGYAWSRRLRRRWREATSASSQAGPCRG